MQTRSGTSQSPPDALHPASPTAPPAISNRQWKGLEIAATHTKQTPDPFLIDNENALLLAAWGRHSCEFAKNSQIRRVAQAGVGPCGFTSALPPLTSSRGPFTGRSISLRFLSGSPRVHRPSPVAIQLIISNRSASRLEMPETYTKQRTGTLSNRHKFTQRKTTSIPTSSLKRRLAPHPPKPTHSQPNGLHLAFVDATGPIAYHFGVTHHLGWASVIEVPSVVATPSLSAAKWCARA